MSPTPDAWYLRFPDGRVLRAGSTEAVRHHLEHGRIPPDSRARRDPGEPWVPLGRTPAFADLVRSGRRGDALPHPAPEPLACLQQGHGPAVARQITRGSEARNPAADNDH